VADLGVKSVMLDRGESVMHDFFGDADYWSARRSMIFSDDLVKVADDFRKRMFGSTDKEDGTLRKVNWEDYMVGCERIS
jgi:peptide-O-fucosyltransferase